MKAIHPDDVLKRLLENTKNSQRAVNLKRLHELCKTQSTSGQDFSRRTMRKFCDVAGIFNGRVLYNKASSPFVELLNAWQEFVGAPVTKEKKSLGDSEDSLLGAIQDPAMRALVQSKLAELKKVRGELNLLKAFSTVKIDQRAPSVPIAPRLGLMNCTVVLTDTEREALKRAVSASFLTNEGWIEGANGQVLNALGRTIYSVGYLRVLRKVLALSELDSKA